MSDQQQEQQQDMMQEPQSQPRDPLFHLSWGAQKFLRRPSPRILSFAVLGVVASLIACVVLSFLIEIDVTAMTQGEIISSYGLREIKVPRTGVLSRIYKKTGETVRENEVIANLSIGQTNEVELRRYQQVFESLANRLGKSNLISAQYDIPVLDVRRWNEADLTQIYVEIQRNSTSFKHLQTLSAKTFKFEVQPLKIRDQKLKEKLALLKKAKHRNLMGQLIESVEDEIEANNIKISSLSNQTNAKLEDSANELSKSMRQLSTKIDQVVQSHQIKSPISGVIGRLSLHDESQVTEGQVLATVVPKSTSMAVQLKMPSKDIGRIRVGQKVLFKLEAYPYQQYGLFEGQVLQVERVRDADPSNADVFLVKTNITPPQLKRQPSSEIVLVYGMRLEATVIVERKKVIRFFTERITGVFR